MIFKVNEAVGGLKHAGLGWQRIVLKRPAPHLLPRLLPTLRNAGLKALAAVDAAGRHKLCSICGYCLVRVELEDGWTMDLCSAMPILRFNEPRLTRWLKDMPPAKLPGTGEKQYTSVADGLLKCDK